MENKTVLSRRQWLKSLTGAAALSFASGAFPSRAQAPSPREKLFLFRYSDVKLTSGPLKAQFDRLHASYRGLEEDRLLKIYRQRAGH